MKKLPDKIYVTPHFDRRYFSKEIDDESVEYVRKDAFIEKALSFIRNCTSYDGLCYKSKCVNIEDFKKYMEEE